MADKVIRIKDLRPQDVRGDRYTLHRGNVLDAYPDWEAPDLIVSDGAYGVRGFRGDTVSADGLVDWYAPHVAQWSKRAKPSTSLWFWNTEVGPQRMAEFSECSNGYVPNGGVPACRSAVRTRHAV